MGRAGTKAGGIFAQNMQAGSVDITITTTDGTATVTLPKAMKSAPKVILTAAEVMLTGTLSAHTKTNKTFVVQVDGTDVTGTLTVDYIAFDDSYN